MKAIYIIIGCLTSLSLCANESDERINAYKGNKLIPADLILPTDGSGGAGASLTFSMDTLSWAVNSGTSGGITDPYSAYRDLTWEEIRAAYANSYSEDLFNYIMAVAAGKEFHNNGMTTNFDALMLLFVDGNRENLANAIQSGVAVDFSILEGKIDGMLITPGDVSWILHSGEIGPYLANSNVTGITESLIAQLGGATNAILPSLTLTGTTTNIPFTNVDFSNCTLTDDFWSGYAYSTLNGCTFTKAQMEASASNGVLANNAPNGFYLSPGHGYTAGDRVYINDMWELRVESVTPDGKAFCKLKLD